MMFGERKKCLGNLLCILRVLWLVDYPELAREGDVLWKCRYVWGFFFQISLFCACYETAELAWKGF